MSGIIMLLALLLAVPVFITAYMITSSILTRKSVFKALMEGRKAVKVDKTLEIRMMIKSQPMKKKGVVVWVEKYLSGASISMAPEKFIRISAIISFCIPLIVFIITNKVLFFILLLPVGPFGIFYFLRYLNKKRIKLFSSQLPDIIGFISSSLKSGYSIMQALTMVAKESYPPASVEISRVLQDINLGKSYEDAFDSMYERNPTEEVDIVSKAILISRETGGNLSNILDTVSETLRQREKIKGEVSSLTAQGKLSGILLTLMPIAIFLFLWVTNPAYISPLYSHPVGQLMLLCGIISQVIGAFVIRKIVKIDW